MNVLQLADMLLTQSCSSNAERCAGWIKASFKVTGLLPEHVVLSYDVQQIGRLDCILVALEGDLVLLLSVDQPNHTIFGFDFYTILARAWLSLTYEALRTIKQRLLSNSHLSAHWSSEIQHTFSKIERVRMAEIKREIARGSKLNERVAMFVPGDEEATKKDYVHGQTILNTPMAFRPIDGSIVWNVFNPDLGRTEEICRRDISECLLCDLATLSN